MSEKKEQEKLLGQQTELLEKRNFLNEQLEQLELGATYLGEFEFEFIGAGYRDEFMLIQTQCRNFTKKLLERELERVNKSLLAVNAQVKL